MSSSVHPGTAKMREVTETMNEDSSEIMKNEINPLLQQIIEICEKNRVPFFCTFQLSKTDLCTTNVPFLGQSETLKKLLHMTIPSHEFMKILENFIKDVLEV